jgi:hypothetical protein
MFISLLQTRKPHQQTSNDVCAKSKLQTNTREAIDFLPADNLRTLSDNQTHKETSSDDRRNVNQQ